MRMLPITVILPVYHRVPASDFERSLRSVLEQTKPVDDIIVVADGPVPEELNAALEAAEAAESTLRVLRNPVNGGVAQAMREGMKIARHRWVARQDADDVSMPERFEKLWPLIESGKYAAVGGAMIEFANGDPTQMVRMRRLPAEPEAVAKYTKSNSPMNNPTVIFDAEAVEEVGGVRDMHLMEDYDLFARLVARGYALRNLEDPLVLFNAGESMFDRRTGREMAQAERKMQENLVRYGLISRPRAIFNFVGRQAFRALPRPILKRVYAILFDRGERHESLANTATQPQNGTERD